jgi:hypothetical protein
VKELRASARLDHRIGRSERLVKLLFLSVLAIFPAQYWFGRTFDEPYPGLFLPGFSGTTVDERGAHWTRSSEVRVTFADGTTDIVTARRLFPGMPYVWMMHAAFFPKPPRPEPPGTRSSYKRRLVERFFPGYMLTLRRRTQWTGVDERTREWLRTRLGELYGERRPIKADVVWYKDTFSRAGGRIHRDRQETASLEIGF